MIKEAKNVDFFTTGRQPTEQDFARISEWIKRDKQKSTARKTTKQSSTGKHMAQEVLGKKRDEG
jgi:hypothetical protein